MQTSRSRLCAFLFNTICFVLSSLWCSEYPEISCFWTTEIPDSPFSHLSRLCAPYPDFSIRRYIPHHTMHWYLYIYVVERLRHAEYKSSNRALMYSTETNCRPEEKRPVLAYSYADNTFSYRTKILRVLFAFAISRTAESNK